MSDPRPYLGRYELRQQVGLGGMGEVWLAYDLELRQEVALKFLKESFGEDETEILKRETKQARMLSHRHILPVYDFHYQPDQPAAISMEYAPNGSLGDKIGGGKRVLEVDEIYEWMLQSCEGFAFAHEECGIIHRDIKPHNLMLDSGDSIKIADFGLSARVSIQLDSETEKVIGNLLTMHYASPQLIWNPGDSRSLNDIYALGVTIFVLLTGTYPFKNPKKDTWSWDPENLLSMTARREKNGRGSAPIPEAWDLAVARCLALDPADRPASMKELSEMLSASDPSRRNQNTGDALHDEASTQSYSGKSNGRRLIPRGISITLISALVGLLAGILWGAYAILTERETEVKPTEQVDLPPLKLSE